MPIPGVIHTLSNGSLPVLAAAIAFALMTASMLGFLAGMWWAAGAERRALKRARASFATLVKSTLLLLDRTQEACRLFDLFPPQSFSPPQADQFEASRSRLQSMLGAIFDRHRQVLEPQPPLQINWVVTPEDRATGLPDRSAFDANLDMLLELGRQQPHTSGVLLVKVDKLDGLRQRYGDPDTHMLLKKFSLLLCRGVRDGDLVCQFASDTFGILIPSVSGHASEQVATGIRDLLRSYHFHRGESGPEVLVTASLGYTNCRADDAFDFVLNRAADALARSTRLGRNQLHIHDGSSLTHCVAG